MGGECNRRESAEAEEVAEFGKEKGSGPLDPNPVLCALWLSFSELSLL